VARQIRPQPGQLGVVTFQVQLAVEYDDVPVGQVVAVITAALGTRGCAKVGEVARGAIGFVVVITRCGTRTVPVPAPGRLVAFTELAQLAAAVDIIAGREDRAFDAIEQGSRCLIAGRVTGRDVARTDEDPFHIVRQLLRLWRLRRTARSEDERDKAKRAGVLKNHARISAH
jgi:hypothetical protein